MVYSILYLTKKILWQNPEQLILVIKRSEKVFKKLSKRGKRQHLSLDAGGDSHPTRRHHGEVICRRRGLLGPNEHPSRCSQARLRQYDSLLRASRVQTRKILCLRPISRGKRGEQAGSNEAMKSISQKKSEIRFQASFRSRLGVWMDLRWIDQY